MGLGLGIDYTIEFEAAAITNALGDYDLFEIAPADDRIVLVHMLELYVTSELGDAAEEWLSLKWIRGHATSGNGTANTPAPVNPNGPTAAGTFETIGSTIASTGSPIDGPSIAFNVRAGLIWVPPNPIMCKQIQNLTVLRMMTTVADDIVMNGTLHIEEL